MYYLNKIKDKIDLLRVTVNRKLLYNNSQYSRQNFFLIISCGRSGTTLLRRKLIEAGTIHIPPESDDVIPELMKLFVKNRKQKWEDIVKSSLEYIESKSFFQFWELDLNENFDTLKDLPKDQQNLYSIIESIYLTHKNTYSPNAELIGDKTPYLILMFDWIKLMYPNVKIINLVRDGRDVILSRINSFGEDLDTATNRWVWAIKEAKRFEAFYGDNFKTYRYEDFIDSPEETVRSIHDFLNVEMKSSSELQSNVFLGDDIKPHHKNLRNPISNNAIGKWQTGFTEAEKKKIELNISKYLLLLGYQS